MSVFVNPGEGEDFAAHGAHELFDGVRKARV